MTLQNGRTPKALLYGELSGGSRPRCRPRLCFTDTCKHAGINTYSWESLARSRDSLRITVQSSTTRAEQDHTDYQKQKAAARKQDQLYRLACDDLYLLPLRQGLPLPDWPAQPLQAMLNLTMCSHCLSRRKGQQTTTSCCSAYLSLMWLIEALIVEKSIVIQANENYYKVQFIIENHYTWL